MVTIFIIPFIESLDTNTVFVNHLSLPKRTMFITFHINRDSDNDDH